MKMRLLVTGSKGQLGSEIKVLAEDFPEYIIYFTGRNDLDISNHGAINDFVTEKKIDCIINCAAYTAVDKAESEPELADRINHLAVKNLAEVSKNKGINLIHISTDYVFNGEGFKPYQIDHPPAPINTYGTTKLAGEEAMITVNPSNSMIVRTSWVYSSHGNNFVRTMIRLGEEKKKLNVITDQVGVPTYAKDLALFILSEAIKRKNRAVEIFHFSNSGVCSWYDFAKEIMAEANLECTVNPIPTYKYPTPAKRPFYSLLDNSKLCHEFNYSIPYWKDSLKNCMQKIINT